MNRSSSPEVTRRGLPTGRPSPIFPYELIRLIARSSAPTPAARVRRLDRKTSQLIMTADLVLVNALKLWREYGARAVSYIDYKRSLAKRPDIVEELYTTLVKWGASPEAPELLLASVYAGHVNVARAMKAAGGAKDLTVFEDQSTCDLLERLEDTRLLKFLFEELGYIDSNLDYVLNDAVLLCNWEHITYLVSRGADPSGIDEDAIRRVVEANNHKILEWVLESGVNLPSNELLADRLASGLFTESHDFLGTVHLLLRGGADPHFVPGESLFRFFHGESLFDEEVQKTLFGDETLFELAVTEKLWEVAAMMLARMDSSDVANYQFLKAIVADDEFGIVQDDKFSILLGKDPNAFNGVPLRLAAARSKLAIVKELLDRGAVPTESALRAACCASVGFSEEESNRNIATILHLLSVTPHCDVEPLIRYAQNAGNVAAVQILENHASRAEQRGVTDGSGVQA
ncbi:hypothetical protein HK104_007484 [Borealophlyctis nickersoniae]|nr:hypothetical protein HK104_007484 [Borealophlyctis nickersoniae]